MARLMSAKSSASQRSISGFTLTEIAIVLGVIGLILGAIWVAASSVYSGQRVTKATQELLSVAQAVRSMYATSSEVDAGADMTFSSTAAGNLTYIQAGVFPSDAIIKAKTAAVNPWNGALSVQSQQDQNVGDAFSVNFDNVPVSACISMIVGNTGSGRDTSLDGVSVGANGTVPLAAAAAVSGSTWTTGAFPVAASAAQVKCTGPTNSLSFSFRLKG